jgi:tripartite ATP-independent transporter DctP family solute receptor
LETHIGFTEIKHLLFEEVCFMKKGLYLIAVLTIVVLCFSACTTPNIPAAPETDEDGAGEVPEESKSSTPVESEYTLKFGYGEAADLKTSLEHVAATHFKEYIERESNGRITVQLYPGGTLGDSEALIQQVQIGSVQGCPTADAKLSTLFSPIQCLSIPYLFDNREVAFKVLDGPIGQEIKDEVLAATGMRILTIGENGGFRCFSNNTREIRTPADMKGLKFRVMQSPIMLNMVENLGATPVAITFNEMYTSIQTNVIQGQENPPSVVRAFNLDEIQPYYTLDRHTYSISFFVINNGWFEALPSDLQQVVLDASVSTEKVHRETSANWDGEAVDDLKDRGMKVYDPTPEEIQLFREATQQPAIEYLKESVGEEWVNKILDAVDNARVELGLK